MIFLHIQEFFSFCYEHNWNKRKATWIKDHPFLNRKCRFSICLRWMETMCVSRVRALIVETMVSIRIKLLLRAPFCRWKSAGVCPLCATARDLCSTSSLAHVSAISEDLGFVLPSSRLALGENSVKRGVLKHSRVLRLSISTETEVKTVF